MPKLNMDDILSTIGLTGGKASPAQDVSHLLPANQGAQMADVPMPEMPPGPGGGMPGEGMGNPFEISPDSPDPGVEFLSLLGQATQEQNQEGVMAVMDSLMTRPDAMDIIDSLLQRAGNLQAEAGAARGNPLDGTPIGATDESMGY